jgi:hypothetical protein
LWPGFFLTFFLTFFLLALEFLARLDGYFATRSLAGDCRIELNTDTVWWGGETGSAKNGSQPAHRQPDRQKRPSSTAAKWAVVVLCQIRQKRLPWHG